MVERDNLNKPEILVTSKFSGRGFRPRYPGEQVNARKAVGLTGTGAWLGNITLR